MALVSLFPAATGTLNNWSLAAGASKPSACMLPDDDATTSISNTASSQHQCFVHSGLPGTAVALLNSGTMRGRGLINNQAGANEQIAFGARLSGSVRVAVDAGSALNRAAAGTGAWTTTTWTQLKPTTGAAYPSSDIAGVNATELDCQGPMSSGASTVWVTSFTWDFDVQIDSGGFAFLIGCYLGPLVAVGLLELPALARALYQATSRPATTRVRIQPGEYFQAWRELREARNPRRVFLSPAFNF